jgi:hypothetical protein
MVGGAVLLAYAIAKRDPVFILGQGAGLLIYGRNLWFTYRPAASGAPPSAWAGGAPDANRPAPRRTPSGPR